MYLNQSIPTAEDTRSPERRSSIHESSHTVQFYEDDELFLDSLSRFIGGALGAGNSCVVIATEAHRRGLAQRLSGVGLDVGFASAANRYFALDAAELLRAFMVNGWPDQDRFVQAIEPVLQMARSGSRRDSRSVVAFGEMVSLLYEEGLSEAALRVEQLWSEVAGRQSLSLRCAYPSKLFPGLDGAEGLRQVCAEHDAIIPAESHLGAEGVLTHIPELQLQSTPLQFALELRQKEIDHRRKVEDRLRETEEFAQAVIENSADWVAVLSLAGRLEYINPQGAEAAGLCGKDALGRKWIDLWDEADRDRAEGALKEAADGKVGGFQAPCASQNAGRRWWDVQISPVRGAGRAVQRLIAVSRDISEVRQAQTAAIHAEKLATAGRMAASIAHEINNPLEAVTNFIFLAQSSADLPETVRRYLELADRELTRVAHIARQTLGFYRSTSVSRWMPVSELVRDVLMIYERRMRNKDLSVEVSVDEDLRVYGKDGELRQALLNLTANAIDACGGGGTIWIRAQRNRKWTNGAEPGIRFTLADNGTGIPAEVRDRVFAPFFTTKGDVGTGIGLWVTKCLVEQRGGYVRFRSRHGKRSGTVMSFFLPETPRTESAGKSETGGSGS